MEADAIRKEILETGYSWEETERLHLIMRPFTLRLVTLGLKHLLTSAKSPVAPIRKTVTSEGDPVALVEIRFPVRHHAIIPAMLDAAMEFVRSGDPDLPHWDWISPERIPLPLSSDPDMLILQTFNEDNQLVLGSVHLEASVLICETFSRERAERLITGLQALLTDAVGEPQTQLRNPKTNPSLVEPLDKNRLQRLSPEEVDILREVQDQHYRSLPDTPFGFLQGLTPREAAQSEPQRVEVARWLHSLEDNNERTSPCAYDFTWMWGELGVEDLRATTTALSLSPSTEGALEKTRP